MIVLDRVCTPPHCSLDRLRLHGSAWPHLQEPLGGRASDRHAGKLQMCRVWRRVNLAQNFIELKWIARNSCPEFISQADFIALTVANVLQAPGDIVEINIAIPAHDEMHSLLGPNRGRWPATPVEERDNHIEPSRSRAFVGCLS